jgi:hypothetical protein
MIETGAMMGGEESGGYGFGMHLPERDGIFADLMLLDLFLREKDAGRWPASNAIAHLHEIAGPSSYRRVDVHFDRAVYPALKDRLLVELPQRAPQCWPAGRSSGPRRSPLTTASSSSPTTDRGCCPLQRHGASRARVHGGGLADAVDANLVAGEAMVRAPVADPRVLTRSSDPAGRKYRKFGGHETERLVRPLLARSCTVGA